MAEANETKKIHPNSRQTPTSEAYRPLRSQWRMWTGQDQYVVPGISWDSGIPVIHLPLTPNKDGSTTDLDGLINM